MHRPSLRALVPSLAGLALVALLGLASGAEGRTGAAPTRVAAVTGPVFAVAQDGPRLAWRGCTEVTVRATPTAKDIRLRIPPFPGANPPCRATPGGGLALAGNQVVWTEAARGTKESLGVAIGSRLGGTPRRLPELSYDSFGEGDWWSDVAADGATAVQGRTRYQRDAACLRANDGNRARCPRLVVGGGVWRIRGRSAVRLAEAPPTRLIAIAADRIAVIPDNASRPLVDVRTVRSGDLVSRFAIDAEPLALALSPEAVAVLVKGGRIIVLDPSTGAIRRTLRVPSTTPPRLALSGQTLVYSQGARLWRVNVANGRRAVAAVASPRPAAFSIEAGRLAWVETQGRTSRIKTVSVPVA